MTKEEAIKIIKKSINYQDPYDLGKALRFVIGEIEKNLNVMDATKVISNSTKNEEYEDDYLPF